LDLRVIRDARGLKAQKGIQGPWGQQGSAVLSALRGTPVQGVQSVPRGLKDRSGLWGRLVRRDPSGLKDRRDRKARWAPRVPWAAKALKARKARKAI